MKQAFKKNKELNIEHIEALQDDLVDIMVCALCALCVWGCLPRGLRGL